jgi:drug/metabolite transporter (DMT)-like permease
MKLFLLTTLTMIAFAANSVLNRMALADGSIDPGGFAMVRLASGAAVLIVLVTMRGSLRLFLAEARIWSIVGLSAYMLGFSFAYVSLPTGTGALILFGGVQITMFCGAILAGVVPKPLQWVGAVIAFAGLVYLLAPTVGAPAMENALLMGVAALGWGVYSLMGRQATNPLNATAANFVFALPITVLVWGVGPVGNFTHFGVVLAVFSGAVTSGLGYALWYWVLPKMPTATAAVAQLTVPLIAALGGVLLLDEALTVAFALASTLVLGGIGISLYGGQRR